MNIDSTEKIEAFLPPVELLERYEELGIGDDLIKLVRKEQEYRQLLQKKYLVHYQLGQLFGFLLSSFIFFNIFDLIRVNKNTEAYILLIVFSLLIAFIFYFVRKDNTQKTFNRNNTNNIRNANKMQNNNNIIRRKPLKKTN